MKGHACPPRNCNLMLKDDEKLTERMSKSCRLGIFSHLRRKCFFTLGSAWKMARGMALMESQCQCQTPLGHITKCSLSTAIWHQDTNLLQPENHPSLDFDLAVFCSNWEYNTGKKKITRKVRLFNRVFTDYCNHYWLTWVFLAPFCDRRALWFPGDHIATAQSGIFDHLVSQELGQSLCRADRSGFLFSVILQLSGHWSVLWNQLKQLRIWHVGSLGNVEKWKGKGGNYISSQAFLLIKLLL